MSPGNSIPWHSWNLFECVWRLFRLSSGYSGIFCTFCLLCNGLVEVVGVVGPGGTQNQKPERMREYLTPALAQFAWRLHQPFKPLTSTPLPSSQWQWVRSSVQRKGKVNPTRAVSKYAIAAMPYNPEARTWSRVR